ncbi:MAG: hypothetical protein JW818_13300 [Pirellulales bacterium]|nr:hypothetical protein [Pirellulales bacterium]
MKQPDDKREPRNYFSRREQWRLLMLVGTLGLVFILMFEARKPVNWAWFDALSGKDAVPDAPAEPPHPERLKKDAAQEPLDMLHLPAKESKEPQAPELSSKTPADPLDAVRDNMVIRPQEHDAWFKLLDELKNSTEANLRERSIGRVTWLQIYEQAPAYRGEVVTVTGTVRRAEKKPAPENSIGVTDYYWVWLFPSDRPSEPVVVVCLDLPKGFLTGGDLAEQAEATGFFFKRWLYDSEGGMALAPLMLARGLRWTPAPPPAAEVAPTISLLLALGGGLLVAIGLTFYMVWQTRRGVVPSGHGPRERNLPEEIDLGSIDTEPIDVPNPENREERDANDA